MAIADPDLDDLGYEEDEEKRKAAIPPPPPVTPPGAHQPSRFDSGSPVAPPVQPYAINQPGDVTPGIGLARGEIASRPPDLGPAVTPPPAIQPKAPGFAERYAALQPPQRNDPRFAVPGWKKGLGAALSGIAAGFSPNHPSAEGIYDRIANGPYERAEEKYEQQAGKITNEAKLADEEQRMKQLDMVPVKVPWQEEPVYVQRKDAAQLQKQVGANAGKEATTAATQEGANKRTEETNKTKETIATGGNQSKEKIATARNESNELIQQRHDATKQAIAMANLDEKRLQGKKAPPEVAKAHETMQGSLSRMNVMEKSYEDAIADPSNQQSMLNLLANHLGMTMGLAKGARINQAMIEEAERSGVLTERIEAHFDRDGFLTGVVLTPRQMGQMVDLARTRLDQDRRALRETEQYYGFEGNNQPPGGGGQHQKGDTRTNRKTGEVQEWDGTQWQRIKPPKQQ